MAEFIAFAVVTVMVVFILLAVLAGLIMVAGAFLTPLVLVYSFIFKSKF